MINLRESRKNFRTVVNSAEHEYWKKQIYAATTEAQVYKLVRWTKLRSSRDPSPLQIGPEQRLCDPLERALALRDALFARNNAANDIETCHTCAEVSISWNTDLNLEEVTVAKIGIKDTAPENDNITVRLLKACWGTIKIQARDLYQACLKLGYVPAVFKVAEVVLLTNSGGNLSSVKSQ